MQARELPPSSSSAAASARRGESSEGDVMIDSIVKDTRAARDLRAKVCR